MAASALRSCKLFINRIPKNVVISKRCFSFRLFNNNTTTTIPLCFLFGAGGVMYLIHDKRRSFNVFPVVHAISPNRPGSSKKHKKDVLNTAVKLTSRERRFIRFASVEYGGQLYMTPQDFLDSVVEAEPRPRLKRKILSEKDLDFIRDSTPRLKKGSRTLFRNLRERGIISYTEYLFLLSILTKPQTGFRIAFNMFDTDGNERVDKDEFMVLERIFSHAQRDRRSLTLKKAPGKDDKGDDSEETEHDEHGLTKRKHVDTTLLLHFFGKKGNQELRYEEFRQFMVNLQTEVLQLEFHEFSKGLPEISELDFARILLRYTHLNSDDYDMYLERLLDRIPEEKGITFEEFRDFCHFLNNLDDFAIAMKMYTLADQPISQEEFQRAVKICTGANLSAHIVQTVFGIFDEDGDGQLSYKEFVAIMKDRLHRGFRHYTKPEGWEAFRHCVKQEMRAVL